MCDNWVVCVNSYISDILIALVNMNKLSLFYHALVNYILQLLNIVLVMVLKKKTLF